MMLTYTVRNNLDNDTMTVVFNDGHVINFPFLSQHDTPAQTAEYEDAIRAYGVTQKR